MLLIVVCCLLFVVVCFVGCCVMCVCIMCLPCYLLVVGWLFVCALSVVCCGLLVVG